MRNFFQTNGCKRLPTRREPLLLPGGGLRWLWMAIVLGMSVSSGSAQTFRLSAMDVFLTGSLELRYSSNVDGAYPEDEDPVLQTGDFYWKPGLAFRTTQVPFFRNSVFSLAGEIAYLDYFKRSDLDTELYDIGLDFKTTFPRLTLGGAIGSDYKIDSSEDQFVPGGVTRDPYLTHTADAFVAWKWRKFRIETRGDWSMERHDYVKYQPTDQDKSTLFAGAYLDVFTWGSLFYSWEEEITKFVQTSNQTDIITKDFGFQGAIPLTWLAHPKVTYSFGVKSTDDSSDGRKTGTWEPAHTLRAEDELKLAKTVTLSGYLEYNNKIYDNDIGFTYFIRLEQLLGARAKHNLTFTQEPRRTFGSTAETETTTYGYNFSMNDLFIYNLNLLLGAIYKEDTPLTVDGGLTESTTILTAGLAHTRKINRQLSRILSYKYTNERSSFHHDGPKEEHLLTYGFSYDF